MKRHASTAFEELGYSIPEEAPVPPPREERPKRPRPRIGRPVGMSLGEAAKFGFLECRCGAVAEPFDQHDLCVKCGRMMEFKEPVI